MPEIVRAGTEKELARLRQIFLQAETDIINEIARLRSRGLIDYHAVAALERVQQILLQMQSDCWVYVPRMVEKYFYVNHPELRARERESIAKHLAGYQNALTLSIEQTDIIQRLVVNLMGEIEEASTTVMETLENAMIGRPEDDLFRRTGLKSVTRYQTGGKTLQGSVNAFVDEVRRDGVTAFVDKAGRNWRLHTYGTMVCRTTARQAEVLSIVTRDSDQDLYRIMPIGTTCAVCAPLEGRVYSKSGNDPDFPPLAEAFGKVDPDGPATLANSWLNIHPNCLHAIVPWTATGRSKEEIERIKRFSSFQSNPRTVDPRSQEQIAAYRNKEKARARYLADYRQFERYRLTIPDKMLKTFDTFLKHKKLNDAKYQEWKKAYREANREADE